jgi:hypothetical protein
VTAVRTFFALVLCLACAAPSFAQNWSFDARTIAMGSVGGGNENLASQMMAESKGYKSIVIPLGLFQVLPNRDVFNPDSDDFDLVKAIEYASAPLHYQFNRDANEASGGRKFVVDVTNAELSTDLNTYRGFTLSNQPAAEGLASPSWGKTFRVSGEEDGPFHGIYVGAGPYLAMRTEAAIDDRIIQIFDSPSNLYFPNTGFVLGNETTGQFALSIIGGYRGRFDLGTGGDRDGFYAAANYRHLHGFRMEDIDLDVRLDTDGAGMLSVNPLLPSPFLLSRNTAESGTGFAIDFGVGVIARGFEASFGVNGIANRINWTDVERRTYFMTNLITGDDEFIETPPAFIGDMEITLPKDYRAHGGYRTDVFYGMAEWGHGFQGDSLRFGAEYSLGAVDVRGGMMYSREKWNPTYGAGFNLTPRFGIDVAMYGTTANIARERRQAIAISLRFMREDAQP